jgi:hypothetical protein
MWRLLKVTVLERQFSLFVTMVPVFSLMLALTLVLVPVWQVLNVVVKEMLQGHPVSEQKLKEILGHTPLQVLGGASLGIATALLYHKAHGLL